MPAGGVDISAGAVDSEVRRCRWLGVVASLVLAVGGAGAGSVPAQDPFARWPGVDELRDAPSVAVGGTYLGLTLLVAAWLWMGRQVRRGGVSARELVVTGVWWAAPLALAPPMWSRDVYSYLAQGEMLLRGLNPYSSGPAALGGRLAADVPAIWLHAPAPYGPVSLALAAGVMWLTGVHTVPAVLGMRIVALVGVALIVRSVPRLARHAGVDPALALWLGVLNPLILAHLVAGAHNDALMIGLMLAGMVLVLTDPPTGDLPAGGFEASANTALSRHAPAIGGIVVITVAALVKAPAVVALAFAVPVIAGRLGDGRVGKVGRPGRISGPGPGPIGGAAWGASVCLVGAVAGLTTVLITWVTRTGYGWIGALHNSTTVRDCLSISTDLGLLVGTPGRALGLLDQAATVSFFRTAGVLTGLGTLAFLLLRVRRHGAGYALALALTAMVVLAPVVHPWYLLWGFVPLAATTADHRLRRFMVIATVFVSYFVVPTGHGATPIMLVGAVVGTCLGLALIFARHKPHMIINTAGAAIAARYPRSWSREPSQANIQPPTLPE